MVDLELFFRVMRTPIVQTAAHEQAQRRACKGSWRDQAMLACAQLRQPPRCSDISRVFTKVRTGGLGNPTSTPRLFPGLQESKHFCMHRTGACIKPAALDSELDRKKY